MRPGRDSDVGFLGLNESLLEIMASDNDFILGHGLKHQEIAVLLKKFAQMPNNSRITVHDIGCLVSIVQYRGIQLSPFGDDTLASTDITVTNLTTRRSIEYSALLPEMIGRYGFYEGRGTSYRLDPAEIMEVFPFFSILGR